MSEMVDRIASVLCGQSLADSYHPELFRRQARRMMDAIREPTEAMWSELARQIVFWNRGPHPTGNELYRGLEMIGTPIPAWLEKEIPRNDHVPPKGTVAVCIFKAMIDEGLNG